MQMYQVFWDRNMKMVTFCVKWTIFILNICPLGFSRVFSGLQVYLSGIGSVSHMIINITVYF